MQQEEDRKKKSLMHCLLMNTRPNCMSKKLKFVFHIFGKFLLRQLCLCICNYRTKFCNERKKWHKRIIFLIKLTGLSGRRPRCPAVPLHNYQRFQVNSCPSNLNIVVILNIILQNSRIWVNWFVWEISDGCSKLLWFYYWFHWFA